ncbi:hypothetical protein DFH09DRAFT_1304109 [Mycena vulgaris]|nr:hypothetical protein DFH09DRAFT_1304109 [Mycena vulgaris]
MRHIEFFLDIPEKEIPTKRSSTPASRTQQGGAGRLPLLPPYRPPALFYHTLVLHTPSQAQSLLVTLTADPALARCIRALVLPALCPIPGEVLRRVGPSLCALDLTLPPSLPSPDVAASLRRPLNPPHPPHPHPALASAAATASRELARLISFLTHNLTPHRSTSQQPSPSPPNPRSRPSRIPSPPPPRCTPCARPRRRADSGLGTSLLAPEVGLLVELGTLGSNSTLGSRGDNDTGLPTPTIPAHTLCSRRRGTCMISVGLLFSFEGWLGTS